MTQGVIRATGWIVLWALLFWISRANHPTPGLNIAATSIMVCAAIAAYWAISIVGKGVTPALKFAFAIVCILCGGIAAALAIHAVYDVAIGPDPRRFGLVTNIGMDTAVVAALVALMSGLDWCLRRIRNANQR